MVDEGASAAVASRLMGRSLVGERAITVDQTNFSVVVGEEAVVKWLRPPVLAPHPGVELLAHLGARGFRDMPRFLGIEQRDDLVLAVATEYLPGALDGWDWFVDDVDAWLHGSMSLEEVVSWAARMGRLTSSLHGALADMWRDTVGARTYHLQALEALDEAMRLVDGDEGVRLRELEPAIRGALNPLDRNELLAAHRIHGDLHAGQFLRAADRLVITDFDGNPLADSAERRLPQSPLIDIASMVQSIDHVGRIVVKRRHPDRGAEVDTFIASAIESALAAYGPVDLAVLHALRVAQELHEFRYAATHLPRWMYVPDAALPALLRSSPS
jgi:maltokinase